MAFSSLILLVLLMLAIFVFMEFNTIRKIPKEAIKCIDDPIKYAEEKININSERPVSCYCTMQEKPLWNLIQN